MSWKFFGTLPTSNHSRLYILRTVCLFRLTQRGFIQTVILNQHDLHPYDPALKQPKDKHCVVCKRLSPKTSSACLCKINYFLGTVLMYIRLVWNKTGFISEVIRTNVLLNKIEFSKWIMTNTNQYLDRRPWTETAEVYVLAFAAVAGALPPLGYWCYV